jgi:hypothetical protein
VIEPAQSASLEAEAHIERISKMADAGEGLIDAQNRIQERMDEREEERARRAKQKADHDPERIRRAESLRLAYTELSRQLQVTSHSTRKQQLISALAEVENQLKALDARAH